MRQFQGSLGPLLGRANVVPSTPTPVHDLLIAAGIAVLVIVVAKWFAP